MDNTNKTTVQPTNIGDGARDDGTSPPSGEQIYDTTQWFGQNISSTQYAEDEQYFNEMYG